MKKFYSFQVMLSLSTLFLLPFNSIAQTNVSEYEDAALNSTSEYSSDVISIPDGLYFAERNGKICYFDGANVVKTNVEAGAHVFQLAAWNGILFGVDAGTRHTIDDVPQIGDGQLFMVNKHSGFGFSKSTIVNNVYSGVDTSSDFTSYCNDPYILYIDSKDGMLYFGGRGVMPECGIRAFKAADAKEMLYSQASDAPLFLSSKNHPFYQRGIVYGALNRGFYKDSKGYYWHAHSWNGEGIYRYNDANIKDNTISELPTVIAKDEFTAMYVDEPNDYIYISSLTFGVRRTKISVIRNGEQISYPSSWECVDDSPVDEENTSLAEKVGIRQFASDGQYVYWCYNAEPGSGLESGIKRVNATGKPVVEYVVKGVEGYGICYYGNADADVTSISETSDDAITVSGNTIKALQDTKVEVYTINGSLIKSSELSDGSSLALNFEQGMYIVKARNTVKKIVVK